MRRSTCRGACFSWPGKLKGPLSNEKITNLTSFAVHIHSYNHLSILTFSQKRSACSRACVTDHVAGFTPQSAYRRRNSSGGGRSAVVVRAAPPRDPALVPPHLQPPVSQAIVHHPFYRESNHDQETNTRRCLPHRRGPGAVDLITVRRLRYLRQADVVVYDCLVSEVLVAEAPLHAERIYVGKASGRYTCSQAEIHALMIDRARAGKAVVHLKGGAPCVFGRERRRDAGSGARGHPLRDRSWCE